MKGSPKSLGLGGGAANAVLGTVCAVLCLASGIDGVAASTPDSALEVQALIDQGRYADAEPQARALLKEAESRYGAVATETAQAIDLLLAALLPGGKSGDPQTLVLAQRAVAIKEKALRPDDLDLARSFRNLAIVHGELGNAAEALRQFQRTLAIREKALGPDHPDVAQSLRNVARAYQDLGDYDTARPLVERSLAVYEKTTGPESPGAAAATYQLGWLLFLQGDFAGSETLFQRALVIQEKTLGPEHPLVATTLSGVGSAAWHSGDFERARRTIERCTSIREKTLGPDHPDLALSLCNLGDMLRELRDYSTARTLFERALAIQEKARGPEHPEVAIVLADLAVLRAETGDRSEALTLLERALAIREKALGPETPRVAEILGAMGSLLMEMGEVEHARTCFERALAILGRLADTANPVLVESLSRLAILDARAGRDAAALEAALRSEEISRRQLRLNVLTLPERLALGYAAMRDPALDLVLTLVSQAPTAESLRRAWQAVLGSRSMILDEMATRRRLSQGVGDRDSDGLATNLASARSRLAYLTLRGPGAGPYGSFARLLDGARDDKERLERTLAERSVPFRRVQTLSEAGLQEVSDALPSGWVLLAYTRYRKLDLSSDAETQGRPVDRIGRVPIRDWGLPVSSTPAYAAFILRQGESAPKWVPLGPAGPIDDAVRKWRATLVSPPPAVASAARQAEEECREAGLRLRRLVWDPASSHLQGVRQVLLVPDGALHLVNFSALPSGRKTYLVEVGPSIHYLSSERDVAVVRGDDRAGHGWLAVGGPDFDRPPTEFDERTTRFASANTSAPPRAPVPPASFRGATASCEAFRSRRWEDLPLAGAEVEALRSQWETQPQETFLSLTGDQAGESTVKRLASGQRVIHLATHGFFMDDVCPSALLGNPASHRGGLMGDEVFPALSGDAPLLLSGLVMAGANRRSLPGADDKGEDGILTAEEIASLDLSGVEWVVLSACGSGLGQVQSGEGILGLRRAFQTAGARTLIMSLWGVKDDAAMNWMSALYRSRFAGASTPEAVRRANLDLLIGRRRAGLDTHPFWWGAFVAAGDWR